MHTHIHVYKHARLHAHTYMSTQIRMHEHTHACLHKHACMHTHIYICLHKHTHAALRGLPQGIMASSTEAISYLTGTKAGEPTARGPAGHELGLEAWMSGMHVRMERSGTIEQRRLDLLIGELRAMCGTKGSLAAATGAAHEVSCGRGVTYEVTFTSAWSCRHMGCRQGFASMVFAPWR